MSAAAISMKPPVRVSHERHAGAVGDREDRVVPRVGDPVAVVARQLRRRPFVGVDERLGHGDVEVLAPAGAFALEQRGEDAAHREQPGGDVAVDVWTLLRRCVAQPGVELHASHLGLHHRRERAPLGPRVGEAPPVDRAVDQCRAARGQRVGVETELLEDAGAEVLEHHVTRLGQLADQLRAALGAQVDRDRALPRVGPREVDADRLVTHAGFERRG